MEKSFVNTNTFKLLSWITLLGVLSLLVVSLPFVSTNGLTKEDVRAVVVDELTQNQPTCDFPTAEEIANLVNVPITDNQKVDDIYDEIFKVDKEESIAEDLALDELNTKDFKREVARKLVHEGEDVEDYHDIDRIVVKDSEVDVVGTDGTVTLELKVYYVLDGDEEETARARLKAEFEVVDLDEDDNYEDAEVDDYELEVVKVYE